MEKVKEYLLKNVAEPTFKISGNKLEQTVRNRLKDELTDMFFKMLRESLEDGEQTILVERIKGGIGIGVNNETAGLIPIQLVFTLKNLDEDILDLGDEYRQSVTEKLAKKAEKQRKVAKAKTKVVAEE